MGIDPERPYSLGIQAYCRQSVPVLPGRGRVHWIGEVHTANLPRPHAGAGVNRTALQVMACAGSEKNPMPMPARPSDIDNKSHVDFMEVLHHY